MGSLPFELFIGRGDVARMIIVEEQPMRAFRLCDMAICVGNIDPCLDRRAGFTRYNFQITLLGGHSLRPGHRDRAVAGNRPRGRDRGYLTKLVEPADEATVNDWDTIDKEEVGKPKGAGFLVENRQVAVGMGRAVRPQDEASPTEIQVQSAGNQNGRQHDLTAVPFLPRLSCNRRR